jgi:hypothetical protein
MLFAQLSQTRDALSSSARESETNVMMRVASDPVFSPLNRRKIKTNIFFASLTIEVVFPANIRPFKSIHQTGSAGMHSA